MNSTSDWFVNGDVNVLDDVRTVANQFLGNTGVRQLPLYADIHTLRLHSKSNLALLAHRNNWRTIRFIQGSFKLWYCLQGDSSHIKAYYYKELETVR